MSKFINRIGEIGYNNQGKKMVIIAYRNAKDIDIQFEDGMIIYNRDYDGFKKGKIKYPIKSRIGEVNFNNQGYKMTIIAYRNSEDIDVEFEDGSISCHKTYQNFKNGKISYPIENRVGEIRYNNQGEKMTIIAYRKEEDIDIQFEDGSIVKNRTYSNFKKGKIRNIFKTSLAYNYPQIAKMIAIPENDLTFEDCYEISYNSSIYVYVKCLECQTISDKKIRLNSIIHQGYSCNICSDGIPITEKFMLNILKQLNEDYTYQLNKKTFNWCNNFEYDFYIPRFNIIIETHGSQHYKESSFKRSLSEEQMNDLFKYKCAKNHVDNYIVVDCRYSELEWLKENIERELSNYFDLSNINWELAWEKSQKSKCVEAWKLWNSGLHDTNEIGKILNLHQATIIRYLKQGVKCGKCTYSKEESLKNGINKRSGKNNYQSKYIICLTTKRIFYSITEGSKYYNCSNICLCCQRKKDYAGKLNDGTKLVWRYLNWKHNKKYRIK